MPEFASNNTRLVDFFNNLILRFTETNNFVSGIQIKKAPVVKVPAGACFFFWIFTKAILLHRLQLNKRGRDTGRFQIPLLTSRIVTRIVLTVKVFRH
jgi:hypothetical protein